MNAGLKKIAFIVGLGILGVSMYWSQDGFNFDTAGDSGYTQEAIIIGWFLAVAVTVVQFVFSSNFRELNMSLILLGGVAYVYSIDTNVTGILHFMGSQPDIWWARALGFLLDATAEPLIAWSLGVSRDGDFLGNIVKTVVAFFNNIFDSAKESKPDRTAYKPQGGGFAPHKPSMPKMDGNRPVFPISERKLAQSGKKHANTANLHRVNPEERPNRMFLDE